MFDLSTPWWELPVRAAVVYGVLLVLMRLSGKRTVGRLGREQDTSASMVRLLRPQRGDLTLRKPMHSAFFGTPLEISLDQIGARSVVLAGLATDRCTPVRTARRRSRPRRRRSHWPTCATS